MIATYKNNRLIPPLIMTACLWLIYRLSNPSVENFGAINCAGRSTDAPNEPEQPATTPIPNAYSTSILAHTADPAQKKPANSPDHLSPTDILLIMKTGGTSTYHRLLIHLITTLEPSRIPPANTVIYSDETTTLGAFTTIDILANLSAETKSHPNFDVYRSLPEYSAHNVYSESAGVAGDDLGPIGGWVIDKYKFLPLIAHAGTHWPDAKWYVYMEDDTYLFLPNVLHYLDSFDWRQPQYLGSLAQKANVTFAHGGSGFALSHGAWEASFGKNPNLVEDFTAYMQEHGCGDQVLGRALNEYGVRFGENGGDEKFSWGFNGLVHWNFQFSQWNWCAPVLSWHKVHNRDVARYYELEKSWDFLKPMRYGDFFYEMIRPDLQRRVEWWDNLSGLYEITSANADSPPALKANFDAAAWRVSWRSVDACEAACESWNGCVQWNYYEDRCRMDDKIVMGSGYAPSMSQRKTALMVTSGWLLQRLERWKCE